MTFDSYYETAQRYTSWDDSIVYGIIDSRLLLIKIELIINVLENGDQKKIRTLALVDSGTTNNFISSQLVREHCLPMQIESDDVPDITLANGAIIKPVKYKHSMDAHSWNTSRRVYQSNKTLGSSHLPYNFGSQLVTTPSSTLYLLELCIKLSCLGSTCSNCRLTGHTLADCLERGSTPMTVSSISSSKTKVSTHPSP